MTLHHTNRGVILSVLCLFVLSGCVTTGSYKKMETDKDQQIAALQNQISTLQKAQADLQQEKDELAKSSAESEEQYKALAYHLADEVHNGELKVTQYKNMLTVDVAEKIFFASGSSRLKDSGKDVLKKLADAMKGYPDKYIRVVGHTDNMALAKSIQSTYPTNWELSAIRATNVVRYLQDAGVAPQRLIISARGEYDPIAPNDTADNRQKNRRIEIMLLDKSLVESIQQQK